MKKLLVHLFCCFIPFRKIRRRFRHKFLNKESAMAHRYLDGLRGIEIGGSFKNSFGLNTLNIDYTDESNIWHQMDSTFKVDIVASGDDLPFKDNTWDFVINSHVLEHFFDPIKAINEWLRVIKPSGYLYMIIPHKERTFDRDREITPLSEIIARHKGELKIQDYAHNENSISQANETKYMLIKDTPILPGFEQLSEDNHQHWNVWTTESFLEFMKYLKLDVLECQDVDDKVGNGFAIVIRKSLK